MLELIFNQLLKMLFIMILAYICYKVKLIDQAGNRTCSNLLLMVINPCLIITVYQTDYDARLVRGLLISFICAIISHVIAIALAHFLVPEKNSPDYCIDRFAAIYSNCGFIGIPLVRSVLGNEGVFYLTAYMAIFNLLAWTHGLGLLQGKFSLRQIKTGLTAPIFIATGVAVILFFLQIRLPGSLLDSMNYVADMNTPLAMMIAGFSVAQADLKKILTKLRIYWVCLLKLFAVPLATLVFLYFAKVDYAIAYTILIASACPTAANTTLMAIRFNKNYTYASEIFSLSTILSMVTIPIVAFIAGFLLK